MQLLLLLLLLQFRERKKCRRRRHMRRRSDITAWAQKRRCKINVRRWSRITLLLFLLGKKLRDSVSSDGVLRCLRAYTMRRYRRVDRQEVLPAVQRHLPSAGSTKDIFSRMVLTTTIKNVEPPPHEKQPKTCGCAIDDERL